jgi:RNA polymerase sigma-70 factor (ECF subfamily)
MSHKVDDMTPALHQSDVLRAADGDPQAFDRLHTAYARMVRALVRRTVRPEEAEDVTQDIFLRVWQRLRTFRGDAAFGTWLHRLAMNAIVDHHRSRRPWHLPTGIDALRVVAISRQPSIERWDMRRALAALPPAVRTPAVLYYIEGRRLAEISRHLGVPVGTTKSRLNAARHCLREHFAA